MKLYTPLFGSTQRWPEADTLLADKTLRADVEAYLESLKPAPEPPDYRELRRREYPDIGDQLDAIWKQLNQDRLGGKELVQEADDVLGKILAVKNKHPKP
jgi:hypothetical protein